jgi:hypothetical protein
VGHSVCAHQMEGANGEIDGAATAVAVIHGEKGLVRIAIEAVDRNQLVLRNAQVVKENTDIEQDTIT